MRWAVICDELNSIHLKKEKYRFLHGDLSKGAFCAKNWRRSVINLDLIGVLKVGQIRENRSNKIRDRTITLRRKIPKNLKFENHSQLCKAKFDTPWYIRNELNVVRPKKKIGTRLNGVIFFSFEWIKSDEWKEIWPTPVLVDRAFEYFNERKWQTFHFG